MLFTLLAPITIAALAIFILGHLWYHPRVFGRAWMRLTNVTPEMAERGRALSFFASSASLLGAFLIASTVRFLFAALGVESPYDALISAGALWVGLCVPVLVGQTLWEGKPVTLLLINILYWLCALLLVGVLITL